jgi:hypothetical protein
MKRFVAHATIALFLLTTGSIYLAFAVARTDGKLTADQARKLIAHLAGIELPSDAVRVKEISALGSSATAVAQIETAFRFEKAGDGKWRVAEIRTGDNKWEDVELITRAVNAEKAARARAELETLRTALEAFRRERGFYVEAKDNRVLIDQLAPRYLARIVRTDPWHRPYQYEGTRDQFTLRSVGADGQANTADDVTLSSVDR